jgi:hypothetical protein
MRDQAVAQRKLNSLLKDTTLLAFLINFLV